LKIIDQNFYLELTLTLLCSLLHSLVTDRMLLHK